MFKGINIPSIEKVDEKPNSIIEKAKIDMAVEEEAKTPINEENIIKIAKREILLQRETEDATAEYENDIKVRQENKEEKYKRIQKELKKRCITEKRKSQPPKKPKETPAQRMRKIIDNRKKDVGSQFYRVQNSEKAKKSANNIDDTYDEALEVDHSEFEKWDGRTNPLKDMDWIFQNLVTITKKVDAPSPGAYAYLQRLRGNPDLMDDFYKLYINRRLPSRNAIEEMEGRMNDDGRDLTDFIDARLQPIIEKAITIKNKSNET